LKQFPAALSDFNRSLQIDSSASEARLDRARLYKAMDDVKSSQEDLQTLSKAIPLQADMHRDIGLLYMSLRMPAEAVTEYDLWVASHGDEADLHVVLNDRCWGRALANTGLDKALADCNAALDVKPEYAGYLDSRGLVYLRQGKLANALRDYDAALKLKPEIAWSLYGRGIARMRMGERERGKQDLAEAKRIFPTIEAEAKKYGIEPPAQ
jgi:tetratricopeptide (TPR) repeat protein